MCLSPFLRSALWDLVRPIADIWDLSVTVAVAVVWACSIAVWFWVAEASWVKRAGLASLALVVSVVVMILASVLASYLWTAMVRI